MKKLSFVARLGVATSALAIACVAWNLLPRASAQAPGSGSKSTSLSPAAKARFGKQLQVLDTFRKSLSASQRKLPTALLLAKTTTSATRTRAALPSFATSSELGALQQTQSVIVHGNLTARVKAAIQREGKLTGFFPEARKATARLTVEAMEHIATATEVTSITINPGPHVKQVAPAQQGSSRQAALRSTLAALSAPRAGTGAVVSEGDKAHQAEQARTDFKVTGEGIKIGVISDSCEQLERLIKLGELPKDTEVLTGQEGEGSSEGTAMMEIIYDLAPGAKLEFSTCGPSPEQMAKNILALQKDGCQIIVDDIGFFSESVYQEDAVSKAIREVSAKNTVYLTAIGNDGNRALGPTGSWDGYFVDAGTGADLGFNEDKSAILNDWNSQKDGFNLVAGNGVSAAVLSWAEPNGKAANDYNLYIVGADGDILNFSTDTQNGSGEPIEAIFSGKGAVKGSSIVVTRAANSKALPMRLFLGGTNTLEHSVGPTGYGHGVAEFALSVGASPALPPGPAPGPFTNKSTVEEFSSTGPRTLFFAPDGAAQERLIKKPDITAADNVTCKTEGFDPFFGTSAAAPHAAAIAALAWSKTPNLTADQIKQRMMAGTIDIDAKGFDDASGNGIVMAPLVLDYTDPTPTPEPTATITPRPTATATPGPSPTPTEIPSLPAGAIALSEPAYSVAENAGNARISVRRVVVNGQGDFGAVSVKYQTYTGGTATVASDYKSVTGTLSWADGDSTTKTFLVPIIDDKAREANETVFLRIYDLKGRGTLAASRKSAILTIIDNESGNVDKIKPKVAITRPSAKGATRVSNVDVIEGTVSDTGGSGVKSVVLYIQKPSDGLYWNGTGWGRSKVALATKLNGKTWSRKSGNPSKDSLKDDFLLITALASDGAGNTAQTTANVFVDAEPPAVYILSPRPGSRLRTLARANGTVSDAGGESTLVLYLRRSSDRKYWTGSGNTFTSKQTPLPVQLAESGEWTRIRWTTLAPGNYVLTATGTDEVGNSASDISEFTITGASASGGGS